MNISGAHLSKEFFELVKAIGESRSKQEEDRIILSEIVILKQRLNDANVPPNKMREFLVRSLYIEMLGHDASFAYIHAVKLAQDKNLSCKKIGYLTCSLCLDNKHELLLLLINTIQKDLGSSNHLVVASALTCITKLLNDEMIPAVLQPILNLTISHSHESIRKKCCMVLHALHKIQPQLVISEARDVIRRALCDTDPSVMAASLYLIHELAKEDRDAWTDCIPSLVSILKQITEHRLPRDFDYHRIPAPWIQVKILSLLSTLGHGDPMVSDQTQEVLIEVLKRAELAANVGYAIIYECVRTITSLFPSSRLLDLAANSISRFISSDNHNLKYVGITGLALIVKVHPSFAAHPEHQLVVLDCLEDTDETLKRRTLELLYRMTNPVNAITIINKLLSHLKMSNDADFRSVLVSKISKLADRFAPSHFWYVQTINSVIELGRHLVPEETAHNLLRLIAEGPSGNDEDDEAFRCQVVDEYIRLIERASTLPDMLMKVAAWTLGEYGTINTVDGYSDIESLLSLLCNCLSRSFSDSTSQTCILSAIIKLSVLRLFARLSDCLWDSSDSRFWPSMDLRVTPDVINTLDKFQYSASPDLVLRVQEFKKLILSHRPGSKMKELHLLKELFPFDGACEDITVDARLSFLDDYVSASLASGARPYRPPDRRNEPSVISQPAPSALVFTPYAPPTKPNPVSQPIRQQEPIINQSTTDDNSSTVFKVSGVCKWGPHGYRNEAPQKPNLVPTPRIVMPDLLPSVVPAVNSEELAKRQMAAKELFSGLDATTPISKHRQIQNRTEKVQTDLIHNEEKKQTDLLDFDNPTSTVVGSSSTPSIVSKLQKFSCSISEVEVLWSKLIEERRINQMPIHTSLNTATALFRKLETSLTVSPVELIGSEGIGTVQYLQYPILIHVKLGMSAADVIIKGSDPAILSEIGSSLQEFLQTP